MPRHDLRRPHHNILEGVWDLHSQANSFPGDLILECCAMTQDARGWKTPGYENPQIFQILPHLQPLRGLGSSQPGKFIPWQLRWE
jgi:hypothetical protein